MAASSRREIVLNIYDLTDEQGTGTFARRIGELSTQAVY